MSKWWFGMPRLQASRGEMDIRFYMDACYQDEGRYMLSWRAANAPVFTVAYRGRVRCTQSRSVLCPTLACLTIFNDPLKEVDALIGIDPTDCHTGTTEEASVGNGHPDLSMRSRTIMFSHHTGLCYVAKPCIHLQAGDPHMIVQVITEQYPTADAGGVWVSSLKVRTVPALACE